MTALQRATSDLVIANRIMAHHGVFDEMRRGPAFGRVA